MLFSLKKKKEWHFKELFKIKQGFHPLTVGVYSICNNLKIQNPQNNAVIKCVGKVYMVIYMLAFFLRTSFCDLRVTISFSAASSHFVMEALVSFRRTLLWFSSAILSSMVTCVLRKRHQKGIVASGQVWGVCSGCGHLHGVFSVFSHVGSVDSKNHKAMFLGYFLFFFNQL